MTYGILRSTPFWIDGHDQVSRHTSGQFTNSYLIPMEQKRMEYKSKPIHTEALTSQTFGTKSLLREFVQRYSMIKIPKLETYWISVTLLYRHGAQRFAVSEYPCPFRTAILSQGEKMGST